MILIHKSEPNKDMADISTKKSLRVLIVGVLSIILGRSRLISVDIDWRIIVRVDVRDCTQECRAYGNDHRERR